MITIANNGPELVSTNYWELEHASKGFFFLSINAGAFRLLVPAIREREIPEMLTGQYAIVSRGKWTAQGGREALEILFEDRSEVPYTIHLLTEQCDRLPADSDRNREDLLLSIWTSAGKAGEIPARYRKVNSLPCLKGW